MLEKEQLKLFHYRTSSNSQFLRSPCLKIGSLESTRPSTNRTIFSTKPNLEKTNIQLFYSRFQDNLPECPEILSLINFHPLSDAKMITLHQLQHSELPVLQYKIRDLVQFSVTMLKTSQFCRINFTDKIVRRMMTLIAQSYNTIAYHNFSHAFSLALLNFQCLAKQFSLKYLYTEEEYFCILISGFSHDINHPGTSNAFEIKTKSELAIIVKNESVLQNMHLSFLWRLLESHPEYDFIQYSQNPSKMKQVITRLIISTDMGLHNRNLQRLQTLKKSKQFDPKHNYEHKWMLMEQIFHACDIGNSCCQFQNYISWAALLSAQFRQLTTLEMNAGLQPTKCFMFKEPSQVYDDQIWFVGTFVQPLWKQIIDICPNLAYLSSNISRNIKQIKEQSKKLKK